jgi:HSP20 family protein
VPPVDIQETEEGYRLQAELPGLTKEDIDITLENNVLRLSGERKFERDVKKESFHRVERTYGTFSRAFSLPQQVNAEGVQAGFENGVLTILVPKAEQAKPRKISIS